MNSAKLLGEIYPITSSKLIYFDIITSTFSYVALGYLGSRIGKSLSIDFYDLRVNLPKNDGEITLSSYMKKNLPHCEVDTHDNHYEFESLELKLTRLNNTQIIIEGNAVIFEEYDEDPRLPFSFVVLVDL